MRIPQKIATVQQLGIRDRRRIEDCQILGRIFLPELVVQVKEPPMLVRWYFTNVKVRRMGTGKNRHAVNASGCVATMTESGQKKTRKKTPDKERGLSHPKPLTVRLKPCSLKCSQHRKVRLREARSPSDVLSTRQLRPRFLRRCHRSANGDLSGTWHSCHGTTYVQQSACQLRHKRDAAQRNLRFFPGEIDFFCLLHDPFPGLIAADRRSAPSPDAAWRRRSRSGGGKDLPLAANPRIAACRQTKPY